MSTWVLAAMQLTDKLGILFVLLLFCFIPLAVFSENPGLTPSGCAQLTAIIGSIAGTLLCIRRKTALSRLGIGLAAYMAGTCLSNLVAMALIPHLLH